MSARFESLADLAKTARLARLTPNEAHSLGALASRRRVGRTSAKHAVETDGAPKFMEPNNFKKDQKL
jgi:hypothetical protein